MRCSWSAFTFSGRVDEKRIFTCGVRLYPRVLSLLTRFPGFQTSLIALCTSRTSSARQGQSPDAVVPSVKVLRGAIAPAG